MSEGGDNIEQDGSDRDRPIIGDIGRASKKPDKETQTGLSDFSTESDTPNRALHLDLKWIKYGTDDKVAGASIILSICLLGFGAILLLCSTLVSLFTPEADVQHFSTALDFVRSGFLFVAGAAMGRASVSKSSDAD